MSNIFIIVSLSLVLLLGFQNCGDAFKPIDTYGSANLSSQVGSIELVSPFSKSKVSLKTFGSGKSGISTNFSDTATIDPSLSMGLVVDNVCALNSKLNTQIDGFGGLLSVNFSRLKPKMKVQVYEAFAKKEIKISQLKTALDKERCVIGISNNGIAQTTKVFTDIEKEQDHHRAIKTVAGYSSFFSTLNSQAPSVTVAIVDSGVDYTHPELKDIMWTSPDGEKSIDFTTEANGLDENGHGTHVAGLVAAQFNAELGTAGVANGVKIMGLKALSKEGSGSIVNIVNAIFYAIDNNADVVNLSLGGGLSLVDDLYLEVFRYAANKNIPLIVAAGNDNQELRAYGSHPPGDMGQVPGIITVGSVNSSDLTKSSFSNFGSIVDISAPGSYAAGSCVISTLPIIPSKYGEKYSTSRGYGKLCGTSMATPIVTGAVALMIKALKFKKIGYTSQTIETLLKQQSQKGNAPTLGANNVLDLEKMASYLKPLVNLPSDMRGIEQDNVTAKYISNLFMNILYRKYDDEGMKYYLDKLDAKAVSLASLNKMFVDSDEFRSNYNLTGFDYGGERAVSRLYLNIMGRNPVDMEVMKLQTELPIKDGKFADLNDLIATLFVSPEGLTVLQSLKVEGVPVFDEDKSYTSDQITARHRKRVAAFTYFTKKYNRRPAMAEVQSVSSYLDRFGAQEAIDIVFKAEPTDIQSFIYNAYREILDRKDAEVSLAEYNTAKQKLISGELTRDSFLSQLRNSTEKKVRDIFKEFTKEIPFKWQVDNAANEADAGKSWDQVRASIKSVVESTDPIYIASQVQFLLAKVLLRSTMISALPPFKATSEEDNVWIARYQTVKDWVAIENQMAATTEAITYRMYLDIVGRTKAEIYGDYAPVAATKALLDMGQSVANVSKALENSDERFIRSLYSVHLLKAPTTVELNRFLSGLKNGTYSRESISNFLQGKSRSPDLTVPTPPAETVITNLEFVKAKYKEILNRTDAENAQDTAGIGFWVNLLDIQTINRTQLETSLKNSTEFALRKIYLTELKRRADFAGLGYWIKEVDAGRITKEQLAIEFRKLCASKTTECL